MKYAIIGGNLLGCSTAFYLRKLLDEQREEGDEEAEIVIFEKDPQLGGNKFSTRTFAGDDVLTGTSSGVDTRYCPLFSSLITDAGIELPSANNVEEWSVFDWEKDSSPMSCGPFPLLERLQTSYIFRFIFHVFMVASTGHFAKLWNRGYKLMKLFRYMDDVYGTLFASWLLLVAASGFGIIPFKWVAAIWIKLYKLVVTDLSAKFSYGAAPYMAGEVANQFCEHLKVIDENNSCSSGITVGHLMKRCGMAKYASASASEQLEKVLVSEKFRDDMLVPAMSYSYSESRFTKTICPKLTGLARASLQVCCDVRGIQKDGKYKNGNKYALKVQKKKGESLVGGFDAVIIACGVDESSFKLDGVVEDSAFELAKTNKGGEIIAEVSKNPVRRLNTSKYMSLVIGDLKKSYFGRKIIARHTSIINSMDFSEIIRVGRRKWRVVSSSRIDGKNDKRNLDKMFENVEKVISWERKQCNHVCTPLRDINGGDIPAFILGKRIINAAAIDRVGNHVEIDCMAARNTASFFKPGFVTWK